jgi:hypothetical protein
LTGDRLKQMGMIKTFLKMDFFAIECLTTGSACWFWWGRKIANRVIFGFG